MTYQEGFEDIEARDPARAGTVPTQEALDVLRHFASQYRSGAQGALLDPDAALALASAIDVCLTTTRAPGEGEPVDDARILEFGKGELVVDTGTYLGRPCVFICAAKTPGEVGTSAKREGHDKHSLQPHEVVLVFPTMEQADAVDAALIPYATPPALAAPSYAQPAPCPKCAGTKFLDKGWARAAIQRTPCPDCAQPAPSDAMVTLKRRLDYRMNEHLCEMKPEFDDSITGFNEAWKIVDSLFAEAAIAAFSEAPREAEGWRDMDSAPKDGRMLRLLIRRGDVDRGAWASFADSLDPYETIGFNALADTLEDEWQFAGWDWCHDCFTDGAGEIVGWQPFELSAAPKREG